MSTLNHSAQRAGVILNFLGTDEWADGQTGGRTDKQTNGRMNGRTADGWAGGHHNGERAARHKSLGVQSNGSEVKAFDPFAQAVYFNGEKSADVDGTDQNTTAEQNQAALVL